jgi:hypothetical protein
MRITVNDGTGDATCALSGLSTTTSVQTCGFTTASTPSSIDVDILVGAADADTGTVKFGDCQVEAGTVATSRIITAGTSATRAAVRMTITTPTGLSKTEGCAAVTLAPVGWGTNGPAAMRILNGNSGGTARLFNNNSGSPNIFTSDGTNSSSVSGAFVSATAKRYRTQWSAARNAILIDAAGTLGTPSAAFTSFGDFDATIDLASNGASSAVQAIVSSIVLGASPDGCRQ